MKNPLTPDNAVMIFFDDQTGLMLATGSMETETLQHNILALARVAHIFHLPVILTTSASTNPQAGVTPMSRVAVAAELQMDWARPTSDALAELLTSHITRWSYLTAHQKH
jgi:hypothetical protein